MNRTLALLFALVLIVAFAATSVDAQWGGGWGGRRWGGGGWGGRGGWGGGRWGGGGWGGRRWGGGWRG